MKKWANELNRIFSREKSKWLRNIWCLNERQIKTMLGFHLTPVRRATIKNTNDNKCWQGWGKRNPHTMLVGM
jgi:hypothetical protein